MPRPSHRDSRFPTTGFDRSRSEIKSIVFDLDGTLYSSDGLAADLQKVAERVVADSRGLSLKAGRELLKTARQQLEELYEETPTLSRTCLELGIELPALHLAFQKKIHPERHLSYDPVLGALLDSLRDDCDLYIYTNNNLFLTRKILALLGVEEMFQRLFTIEFRWTPKPDRDTLRRILEEIGGPIESFLFVGDRQQVDISLPRSLGITTLLTQETSDLLQIHKILGIIP